MISYHVAVRYVKYALINMGGNCKGSQSRMISFSTLLVINPPNGCRILIILRLTNDIRTVAISTFLVVFLLLDVDLSRVPLFLINLDN